MYYSEATRRRIADIDECVRLGCAADRVNQARRDIENAIESVRRREAEKPSDFNADELEDLGGVLDEFKDGLGDLKWLADKFTEAAQALDNSDDVDRAELRSDYLASVL